MLKDYRIELIVHLYLHFLCSWLKNFEWLYQVFLSNTNNLHRVVWFKVFQSNTNNYTVLCSNFYLIIVHCLNTVIWSQVTNNNNNP